MQLNSNILHFRGDLLEVAKRDGMKSAEPFIEKAVGIVRNYPVYGEKAGVGEYWIHVIKEEIASRVDNL